MDDTIHRESDNRFRNYFNMPLKGIAITSPEKGWIDINDKISSMLGYSKDEILKMTWAEMTYPEDLAADEKLFNKILSGEIEQYNIEKRFIRKDKSIIWTNLSVGCVRKEDGSVDYFLAILEDITKRKTEEEIFKSKMALFEAQINATNEGILVVDQNQKKILINNRIIEIFNVPSTILEDSDDTHLLKYVAGLAKNPDKFLEKVMYLYNHNTEKSHEEIEFIDGMVLDRYSAPVIGKDGKNYGRIWTFRDITERTKLNHLLQVQKNEQETILDSIPAWIFYKDNKNNFIRVNKSFANAMGLQKSDLEGKSLYDIYPKDQADKFLHDDIEVIKSGNPKINIIEPIKLPTEELWVQTDKIPYKDLNGNIIGVIGFTIDITNKRKAEDIIKKHGEDLENLNKVMVGRELEMIKLKKEIDELKNKTD